MSPEEMDRRVEDVARTLHYADSTYRDDYLTPSFEWTWETEGHYAIKRLREEARNLIEVFDERAR